MGSVMATAARIVFPHIVKEPGYCGGKAAIDDTRVRVNNVAFLAKQGLAPQKIRDDYPDLTLAQVHVALTYYYDHTDEIEAELAAEDQAAEDFEHRKAELLAKRAGR